MPALTSKGKAVVEEAARRHGLSTTSALSMLEAVHRGHGTMAQFQCPEFGSGQWMRGGMTMVSDMFNHDLKARVDAVCRELSEALAQEPLFEAPAPTATATPTGWPAEWGAPSASGSQNDVRYHVFPAARRLVLEQDGRRTIYDTGEHRISGVSQQQGASTTLTFATQHGTIPAKAFPEVAGPAEPGQPPAAGNPAPQAAAAPSPAAAASAGAEPLQLLEKLASLRDAGILSEAEFAAKKAEILQRL